MIHPPASPASVPPADEESERCSLKGLNVLVTRPEHQAGPLCQWIEQHGGVAIRCPALVICEPHDWTSALAVFDRLAAYDLAIFTSANAVGRALPLIQARGGFPPRLEIAAIGQATARMLKQCGVTHCLRPEQGFTSEALLALPRLQNVTSQALVIVGGEGGRELLADVLTKRGARVVHAAVYRRERPMFDFAALRESWARREIGATVVTSTESLVNLFDMLGSAGQDYLRDTPLIVVSARTRQTAADYGCRRILLARGASDDAIAATLLALTTHFLHLLGNPT